MNEDYDIIYLKREAIDINKWDRCIEESCNGLIYAYSFYLDQMATHWDALILSDYEAVMPLTWNKKWGITYLYQPSLTPQLGIFSRTGTSERIVNSFIRKAGNHFKFAEIFFNYNNYSPRFRIHHNYILDLNSSYHFLQSKYEKDLQKNLKRARRFHFKYVKEYDLKKALSLHEEQYRDRTPHVKSADYKNFEKLCFQLKQRDAIMTRAVVNSNDALLALAMMLISRNRIYLLESTTSDEGRKMQSNHFLLDAIIQEFCEKELILDFVGSDIPGIAHFYKNFGTRDEPYFFLKINKLPWPLNLFK